MAQYANAGDLKLTGTTTERWRQVEREINRLARRLSRRFSAAIPPVIINAYCVVPDDGHICTLLIPFAGVLSRIVVTIGKRDPKGVMLHVLIRSAERTTTREVMCSARITQLSLDTSVYAGSVVVLRTETPCRDIAVGVLLQAGFDDLLTVITPEEADDGTEHDEVR